LIEIAAHFLHQLDLLLVELLTHDAGVLGDGLTPGRGCSGRILRDALFGILPERR
jgi:hypothetical protein